MSVARIVTAAASISVARFSVFQYVGVSAALPLLHAVTVTGVSMGILRLVPEYRILVRGEV